MQHIVFVLDASSSMKHQRSDVITGVNGLMNHLRSKLEEGEDAVVSCVTFAATLSTTDVDNVLLSALPRLHPSQYRLSRGTALYDAIGTTLTQRLEPVPVSNVVVVIATDGIDNESMNFTQVQISEMVTRCKQLGWRFIYICEDSTAMEEGTRLGLGAGAPQSDAFQTPRGSIGSMINSADVQMSISAPTMRTTRLKRLKVNLE